MKRRVIALAALSALAGCTSGAEEPFASEVAEPATTGVATPTNTATPSTSERSETRLYQAAEACGIGYLVERNGASIMLVTLSTQANTATWDQTQCLLRELEAPAFVTDRIMSERSDGETLTDSWNDLEIRWSYSGLEDGSQITIIDRELT